jgi:hypothetical protein
VCCIEGSGDCKTDANAHRAEGGCVKTVTGQPRKMRILNLSFFFFILFENHFYFYQLGSIVRPMSIVLAPSFIISILWVNKERI